MQCSARCPSIGDMIPLRNPLECGHPFRVASKPQPPSVSQIGRDFAHGTPSMTKSGPMSYDLHVDQLRWAARQRVKHPRWSLRSPCRRRRRRRGICRRWSRRWRLGVSWCWGVGRRRRWRRRWGINWGRRRRRPRPRRDHSLEAVAGGEPSSEGRVAATWRLPAVVGHQVISLAWPAMFDHSRVAPPDLNRDVMHCSVEDRNSVGVSATSRCSSCHVANGVDRGLMRPTVCAPHDGNMSDPITLEFGHAWCVAVAFPFVH